MFPVFQFVSMTSHPFTGYHWVESERSEKGWAGSGSMSRSEKEQREHPGELKEEEKVHHGARANPLQSITTVQ